MQKDWFDRFGDWSTLKFGVFLAFFDMMIFSATIWFYFAKYIAQHVFGLN